MSDGGGIGLPYVGRISLEFHDSRDGDRTASEERGQLFTTP